MAASSGAWRCWALKPPAASIRGASFDHALYAQGRLATSRDWVSSLEPLGERLSRDPADIVLRQDYGYRRLLYGTYENRDVRVALA